jgi:hypothetical protein
MAMGVRWPRLAYGAGLLVGMLAFGGCASSLNTGAASIGGTLAQGANPKHFRDEARHPRPRTDWHSACLAREPQVTDYKFGEVSSSRGNRIPASA